MQNALFCYNAKESYKTRSFVGYMTINRTLAVQIVVPQCYMLLSPYLKILLSPRTTKLWRGYRVCPVRMYVSTYVRSFVCSSALATSFIIQFRYNFTQVLDMTIPRTSSRFAFQRDRVKVKVAVTIFRKTLSSL